MCSRGSFQLKLFYDAMNSSQCHVIKTSVLFFIVSIVCFIYLFIYFLIMTGSDCLAEESEICIPTHSNPCYPRFMF